MKAILSVAECSLALWVHFVSCVTLLDHHSSSQGRFVYFLTCAVVSVFLWVMSKITAEGDASSDCRGESTRFDWFSQEFLKHGDAFLSIGLAFLCVVSIFWPDPVPPFLIIIQFFASFSAGLWLLLQAWITYQIAKSQDGDRAATICYRASARAHDLVRKPYQ